MPSTRAICGFFLAFVSWKWGQTALAAPPSLNAIEIRDSGDARATEIKQGLMADIEIFNKGEEWARRYPNADETQADVDLRKKALARADQRSTKLTAGEHPWSSKRGRVVRGYRSTVDASVQPYRLIIPA